MPKRKSTENIAEESLPRVASRLESFRSDSIMQDVENADESNAPSVLLATPVLEKSISRQKSKEAEPSSIERRSSLRTKSSPITKVPSMDADSVASATEGTPKKKRGTSKSVKSESGEVEPEQATDATPKLKRSSSKKSVAFSEKKSTAESDALSRSESVLSAPQTPKAERATIPKDPVTRQTPPEGAKTFKAMLWNVAGLRALLNNGSDRFAELMAEEQPDVLGFNETKIQEEHIDAVSKQLKNILPGYTAHFTCSTTKKGYSGVGALVKNDVAPIRVTAGMGVVKHDEEGRTLTLEYEKFFIVFVYVPNSGEPMKLPRLDYRVTEWDPDLRSYLKKLDAEKPVMLLGDLNVAHLDADFYNPHEKRMLRTACTTPEERKSFGELLELGFVDTWRKQHPTATGCFSQWSVRAGNRPFNRGNRFDYAVVSEVLTREESRPLIIDSFICDDFGEKLSDHCPVGVTAIF